MFYGWLCIGRERDGAALRMFCTGKQRLSLRQRRVTLQSDVLVLS